MEFEMQFARLVAELPRATLANSSRLASAGEVLGIQWPDDYVALVAEHNGVSGMIGPNALILTPVEELVEATESISAFFPDLVIIASNGGGFSVAYDRNTLDVLFFSDDSPADTTVTIGKSLGEAFLHLERDDVLDCPPHVPVQTPTSREWPDDWRKRVARSLRTPQSPG